MGALFLPPKRDRGGISGRPKLCTREKENPSLKARIFPYKKPKPRDKISGVSGAATRIRTGDLILTKDVLYQLSHSSMSKDISS